MCIEQEDEIMRLRAANQRLRRALSAMAAVADSFVRELAVEHEARGTGLDREVQDR